MFETASGSVLVTDFMPVRGDHPDIVRIVQGLKGRVQMQSELAPPFRLRPLPAMVHRNRPGTPRHLRSAHAPVADPHQAPLDVPAARHTLHHPGRRNRPLRADLLCVAPAAAQGDFVAQRAKVDRNLLAPLGPPIALQGFAHSQLQTRRRPLLDDAQSAHLPSHGRHRRCTHHVAAGKAARPPATGTIATAGSAMPPSPCSLCSTPGIAAKPWRWRDWLLRALAGDANQVQIMYGIRGERDIAEWELPWLRGYKSSKPVRVGNAAANQFQLDIFGEVLDAMFQGLSLARIHGLRSSPSRRKTSLDLMVNLVQHLEKVWRTPDQGIWEMRSGPRHYTYSKLMVWVAFDRASRIAKLRRARHLPVEHWEKLRDRVHREICARAFNPRLNTFVQSYGSTSLDASLLFLPLVGFLPIDDPRVTSTIAAIEKKAPAQRPCPALQHPEGRRQPSRRRRRLSRMQLLARAGLPHAGPC